MNKTKLVECFDCYGMGYDIKNDQPDPCKTCCGSGKILAVEVKHRLSIKAILKMIWRRLNQQ